MALQDDLDLAASALGRLPDTFHDDIPSGQLSTLWRLHGRLAFTRGDQSRAIALLGRALRQAEAAHDSRGIANDRVPFSESSPPPDAIPKPRYAWQAPPVRLAAMPA